VKHHIIDMRLNASGVRNTARVLHISTDTVLNELRKKEAVLEPVNTTLLRAYGQKTGTRSQRGDSAKGYEPKNRHNAGQGCPLVVHSTL
jgi:hypothetical protein